jgi:1,4-dihydroxy-2-naphthoate octaprenyltransferase
LSKTIKPLTQSVWWIAIRPKTLPASISPIILGSALAFYFGDFSSIVFILALVCALALQIAVNLANDFFDGKSGVDTDHRKGPQRVTQSGLVADWQIKWVLGFVCLIALTSGMALVVLSSYVLLYLGLASLLAVFAYSGGPKPLASHALGEITVLVFFGWLAVAGTFYAHTLAFQWNVFGYGTVAGLISGAIMLVNNIRDIPTDAVANKNTLAVRLGDAKARGLYQLMLVFALIVHFIVSFDLGLWSLLPMVFVAPMTRKLFMHIKYFQDEQLNLQLASTAKLEFIYCITMSLVLVVVYLLG